MVKTARGTFSIFHAQYVEKSRRKREQREREREEQEMLEIRKAKRMRNYFGQFGDPKTEIT